MKVESEQTSPEATHSGFSSSLLAVVIGVAVLAAGWYLSKEQKMTILVVSLDTTRWDHLTAYGYDKQTTPTLARLAEEGTRFTNARSTTSWTLPSHMSLFTGLPADVHNVTIDFQVLDTGRRTMGQVFQDNGFHTVGIYSAPYLHGRFGFDRGMDFYESATRLPMVYDLPPEQMSRKERMEQLEFASHREVTSTRVRNRALQSIKNQETRPKAFMFLHFFDPHYDYMAPPEISQKFVDPGYRGPVNGEGVTGIPSGIPKKDMAQLMALYDAEIRFVDENLNTVLQSLEDSGRIGSTVVVVTADHGEEFFEDGKIGHRMGLREEVIRVPLIFWGPGIIPEGLVIDDEVALYDILPTLMDYAGIPDDPLVYGRSLRPLIDGDSLAKRPSHSALTFLHREGPDYYTRHDAIVYEGMKYVRRVRVPWSPDNPTMITNPPDLDSTEVEIYDLAADPGEQHNLYSLRGQDPRVEGIIREFEAETTRQLNALQTFSPEGMPASDGFQPESYEQHLEILRGLGYLSPVEEATDESSQEEPASAR